MTTSPDHASRLAIITAARTLLADAVSATDSAAIAKGAGITIRKPADLGAIDAAMRSAGMEFRQIAGDWQGWRWTLNVSTAARKATKQAATVHAPGLMASTYRPETGTLTQIKAGALGAPPITSEKNLERATVIRSEVVRAYLRDHPAVTHTELVRGTRISGHHVDAVLRSIAAEILPGTRVYQDGEGRWRKTKVLSLRVVA